MSAELVSTIVCPHCLADLDARAERCSRCGRQVSARTATGKSPEEPRIIDRPWLIVIVLLHLGLLGIPLYLKTRYSLATRLMICAASIAYTFLALAGIAWGLIQIARLWGLGEPVPVQ
jgi:ribosomal protein L40E